MASKFSHKMVRDLDSWSRLRSENKKDAPGENCELVTRILKLVNLPNSDELFCKYKEYILRQKITLKENVSEVFKFEKSKNDIILDALQVKEESIRELAITENDFMNQEVLKITQIDQRSQELDSQIMMLAEKQEQIRHDMDSRKRLLESRGKVPELRHIMVLRDAVKNVKDRPEQSEISETSPISLKLEEISAIQSVPRLSLDIFEADDSYLALKNSYAEVAQRLAKLREELYGLGMEAVHLKRSIAVYKAHQIKFKEQIRGLRKSKREFCSAILKAGSDSRLDGCVWLLREIEKLGGKIREELLPDFIDQKSKDFILKKYVTYSEMMDLRDRSDFLMSFYKAFDPKTFSANQEVTELNQKNKRKKEDPFINMVAESSSINLKGRFVKDRTAQKLAKFLPDPPQPTQMEEGENAFLTGTLIEDNIRANRGYLESVPIEPIHVDKEESSWISRRSLIDFLQVWISQEPHAEVQNFEESKHSLHDGRSLLSFRLPYSRMIAKRVAQKKKEFKTHGVKYIGDPQYTFPYSKLFGSSSRSLREEEAIGQEIIKHELQKYFEAMDNSENTIILSPESKFDDKIEEDPFQTHVLFFDNGVLINEFETRVDFAKSQNRCQATINSILDDLSSQEATEANRIMSIYRSLKLRSAGQYIPYFLSQKDLDTTTKEELVVLPQYQDRPLKVYQVDLLLYLSTFMGHLQAKKYISKRKAYIDHRETIQKLKTKSSEMTLPN